VEFCDNVDTNTLFTLHIRVLCCGQLNRSDSDSKVRRRQHGKFERQSADRKNVRIKKVKRTII